ncbi:Pectin lyase-like superfamily protein [Abeliophyllum distichum]|uniref:Pectate lyase n=1 Tax=Abeliophyllum distichum TaxID=126358 RepID=A0ABD1RXN1_9LAMI
MNVIDKCWRTNPNWRSNRQQLAKCSVGYAGKMIENIGQDVTKYKVTDPSDDPLDPKPGTLRYAMTNIKGKVWITFQRDMKIKLGKPLLVSSFSTIDGRGLNVHIANGGCLVLRRVTNVIIHGLRIHDCKAQGPGQVMGPDREITELGQVGWRRNQNDDLIKDMDRPQHLIPKQGYALRTQRWLLEGQRYERLLLHSTILVRVAYKECRVNNLYQGWGLYAIGGSMNPSIKSQANLFIAPKGGKKEITWRNGNEGMSGNFHSVADVFENGASFRQSDEGGIAVKPEYSSDQVFQVADATTVRSLTKSAGALKCPKQSIC